MEIPSIHRFQNQSMKDMWKVLACPYIRTTVPVARWPRISALSTMPNINRPIRAVFASFILLLSGCTKEKAEAIKNSAEQFRNEAASALKEITGIFLESVSVPVEDDATRAARLAQDLGGTQEINAKELSFVLQDPMLNKAAVKGINQEFDRLEAHFDEFAAMFRSLPKGSFLATKSVAKAEKHAINLTLELINFAHIVEKMPVHFSARRTILLAIVK